MEGKCPLFCSLLDMEGARRISGEFFYMKSDLGVTRMSMKRLGIKVTGGLEGLHVVDKAADSQGQGPCA